MFRPMRVLIIGATGGTGRHVLANALQQGHDVTVFVRHPDRVTERSDRLRIVTGSLPDDQTALGAAVMGQDAVISTLGVGRSLKSGNLMARSMPVLVRAMESQGVRRLIVMSGYGVGTTYRDMPFITRMMIKFVLKDLYADKAAGEEAIFRSALDWTIAYASTLTNGPKTGVYRVGERLSLRGLPTISRADVADFLLKQVSDRTYLKKGVLVST
jgi:putative NADH-flavin reductase